MSIIDIFNDKEFILSFEVIPFKNKSNFPSFENRINNLSKMNPDFISVTYGAAGRSKNGSMETALYIKNKYNIEVLSHLTCINSTEEEIEKYISELADGGINNILALRGDIVRNSNSQINNKYRYAKELVKYISRKRDMCIAVAAYPEGHAESSNLDEDIFHLKEKVDCGADFLITQFFFSNDYFYTFREKLGKIGLDIPLLAGIMPVVKARQVKSMSLLGGASLPKELLAIIDKYGENEEDFFKAGVEYSLNQTRDLVKNGIKGIHLYTMNDLTAVNYIVDNLYN
ncbi:MAG: methylenetetrahydrofolate reductase [NAD(P)H] [Clostridium sp.]|uniref:methylenetetrahydrofolate reductase [NAD(P)H] n=1 Tax=Clostridium sp. TaxID=1506 RepID=UPI0025C16827|nr:methylenetetrahydrofolate reductase [NAD(P)H] [Clostridium sp.]MCH3964982.1 methylenetetrahydrofolate reductase [NAD(P)H] [Clostridium sp.]MCI1716524.1 methylenetetrahydrofolate reductase [NAD(P)H] [Clostridium sp.]MCI1800994.1 methylenetetrahydrofolate reductase [NAD(P)H] [Clostridium sp.]MCI1814701.1 methylenetetrahydrofolate reductase [NAD(P)H] [Clostridium sp.]MCI1871741.1 methylenetetrahydrofolate reductase [NAD(P)H] [Clostridium sp.]